METKLAIREPASADALAAELKPMTVAELKDALTSLMGRTAEKILRMALIVRELEIRGENIGALKIGMLGYLRAVASGQALPEVIVRFADRPNMLRKAIALAVSEQQRLLKADDVTASRMLTPLRPHSPPEARRPAPRAELPAATHEQRESRADDQPAGDEKPDELVMVESLIGKLQRGLPKSPEMHAKLRHLVTLAQAWVAANSPEDERIRLAVAQRLATAAGPVRLASLRLDIPQNSVIAAITGHEWFGVTSAGQYYLTTAGRRAVEVAAG